MATVVRTFCEECNEWVKFALIRNRGSKKEVARCMKCGSVVEEPKKEDKNGHQN